MAALRRLFLSLLIVGLGIGAVCFFLFVRPEVPERTQTTPATSQPTPPPAPQTRASQKDQQPVQVAVVLATEPAQPTASPSPQPTAQPTISPTPLPPFIFTKGEGGLELLATTAKTVPAPGDVIGIDKSITDDPQNWAYNLLGLSQFVVRNGQNGEATGEERLFVQAYTHLLVTSEAPQPKGQIVWPQAQLASFLVKAAKEMEPPTPTATPAPTDTAIPPTAAPTAKPTAAPAPRIVPPAPPVRAAVPSPQVNTWTPPPQVRPVVRVAAPTAKPPAPPPPAKPVADSPQPSAPGGCSSTCP